MSRQFLMGGSEPPLARASRLFANPLVDEALELMAGFNQLNHYVY